MNIVRLSSLRREHPEIEAQAQAWVIRLDGDSLSSKEREELREWLSRSPVHKQLFQEAARFWCGMDRLAAILSEPAGVEPQTPPRHGARPVSRYAAAAMILLVLAASFLWRPSPPASGLSAEYFTPVGQVRQVDLPDGSSLTLNTDSRIKVRYDAESRSIHLVRGEAHFDVAHDPARPFLVYAGSHAVRAVGTAFAVRNGGEGVDVKVLEGRIEVSSLAAAPRGAGRQDGLRVPLGAGQQGIFGADAGAHVSRPGPDNLARTLSWRDGMLVFEGDTLESVVDELNRYTLTPIVIADAGLRELRIGGHFRVGEIGAILATLERDFRIHVARSDELITLSR